MTSIRAARDVLSARALDQRLLSSALLYVGDARPFRYGEPPLPYPLQTLALQYAALRLAALRLAKLTLCGQPYSRLFIAVPRHMTLAHMLPPVAILRENSRANNPLTFHSTYASVSSRTGPRRNTCTLAKLKGSCCATSPGESMGRPDSRGSNLPYGAVFSAAGGSTVSPVEHL